MAIATKVTQFWHDGKRLHVQGTLTASDSYATPGDTVDFSGQPDIYSAEPPVELFVQGESGFVYRSVIGAALNNSKLKVLQADYDAAADGPLIEIPDAAYPAGVTGDTIRFYAIFKAL